MEDLKIRLFRQDLVQYINSVDLPMEVKRLVLKDVYNEVSDVTETIIKSELDKQKAESNKEEVSADGIDENLQQDKLG